MRIIISEEQFKNLVDPCKTSEKIKNIYDKLSKSAKGHLMGAGTLEQMFVDAIRELKTPQEYKDINTYISCLGAFENLDEWIIDEFNYTKEEDLYWLKEIDKHFNNVIGNFKNFSHIENQKKVNPNLSGIDLQVYQAAIEKGWSEKSAMMLIAQFRHETKDYTSNVFKCNNNLGGMTYVGQPLAKGRGNIRPPNEITKNCKRKNPYVLGPKGCNDPGNGKCSDSDFYANYASIGDSVKDKLDRYFETTRGGVTPDMLKTSTNVDQYASLLKKRNYYADTVKNYVNNMNSKLKNMGVFM